MGQIIKPVCVYEWWDVGVVVCMGCRWAKGHRLPECLVCNRQQWAREGPGARKITSI